MKVHIIIKIKGIHIVQPMKIATKVGIFYVYSPAFFRKYTNLLQKKKSIQKGNHEFDFSIPSGYYESPTKGKDKFIFVGKEIRLDHLGDLDDIYQSVRNEFKEFLIVIDLLFTALFSIHEIYILTQKTQKILRICYFNDELNIGGSDQLYQFASTQGISNLLPSFINKIFTNWKYSDDIFWLLKEKVRSGYISDKYLNYASAIERLARRYLTEKKIIRIHNKKEILINGYEKTYSKYRFDKKRHYIRKIGMTFALCKELGLLNPQIKSVIENFYDVYNTFKHDTCDETIIMKKHQIGDMKDWMLKIEDFRILTEQIVLKVLEFDKFVKYTYWTRISYHHDRIEEKASSSNFHPIPTDISEVKEILAKENFNFIKFDENFQKDREKTTSDWRKSDKKIMQFSIVSNKPVPKKQEKKTDAQILSEYKKNTLSWYACLFTLMDKYDRDLNSLGGFLTLFHILDQNKSLYDQFPDYTAMELLNSASGKEIKLKFNKEFEIEIEHESNAIPSGFLEIKLPNGDIMIFNSTKRATQMSDRIISTFKLRYIDLRKS
jgi:hypothetical protein